MFKNYSYTAPDGNHWPDAHKGSDLFYAIDFSEWLSNENDQLTSVDWVYPSGLTSTENFLVGNEATIKLASSKVGTFRVTCKITSEENSKVQTVAVPMMLRVY